MFVEDRIRDGVTLAGWRGGCACVHDVQTTFANRTDREQTYSFRADRTTRSTCAVSVEQACTTGVEVGVRLTTPGQILEANAGFRREVTLASSESETIEQELAWSVDSQVSVLGRHVGDAKLVVLEQEYDGRFAVKSRIRYRRRLGANRARQLYKNISMLFLFPVKDGKLSTGVIAISNASCYG